MKETSFQVFKGLQSPIILKGFKGKYIYWSMGLLLGTFILAVITMILLGGVKGIIIATISLVSGLFYISQKQKKGLHSKNKERGVFINRAKYQFKKNEEK